jgi:hypothetical protein
LLDKSRVARPLEEPEGRGRIDEFKVFVFLQPNWGNPKMNFALQLPDLAHVDGPFAALSRPAETHFHEQISFPLREISFSMISIRSAYK